ncbi:uncharacterized protein [Arachis hypogaea]|uniref:AAA+ ATPase domain-containing protein n=1 Tax=Arachis hypogaea TaxID=3818 RepID=A0A445CYA1_ARAHY|nr:uncharacterized protein LOC112803118 [Arachis hypogaea]QHO44274.1 uncharacterized protein DS421_5g169820 [Arachis hypogaea]RYR55861.1 hypothetical protein Ahy_A05g021716 [Arachis hypogaea]
MGSEREEDNSATNPTTISSTLKIKISSSSSKKQGEETSENSNLPSPNIKNSTESSPYGSPLVSPPSSAFVSALQSPYISPRAITPDDSHLEKPPPPTATATATTTTTTHPSTPEDVPSSSYTPPSDQYEFSDDNADTNLKFVTCVPIPEAADPRISFSFPVPRVSFAKGSVSPASNAKLRSCDVYIGFHGQNPKLLRFCKWLKSDLELQGIDCLLADRAKYTDSQSHEIADRVICSVSFGLVVVSSGSFLNHLSMEEVRFFAQKKNLIPLLFDTGPAEIMDLLNCNSIDKECREAIDGLMRCNEFNLGAHDGNWRSCISKTTGILRARLGRMNGDQRDNMQGFENLPFPRNQYFVGREKEIMEIEGLFFGRGNCVEQVQDHCMPFIKGEASGSGQSEGLADEESEPVMRKGRRYISLEMGKSKEPTLEAWVEPLIGNNSLKRLKHKKSKSGNFKSLCSSVICITGVSGIGKSELALEYSHRYHQRYKMVLWVGGEARYLRQNILNLSLNLGLDVGADSEMERGRIRSFEEQELEAFKRIKRELFGETPYLLIIDNLETEEEWWEGKDIYDLIPRNTGGTHVIITTRLSKVNSYDTIQLPPLPLSEAMILIKGRKRREYPADEVEFLEKFNEKLGWSSFGLWVIGSMLSELAISPSALFEAINQMPLSGDSNSCYMSIAEEQWRKSNPFLMKSLLFCVGTLEKTKAKGKLLAMRMLLVGGWFSPAPISASLLVNAAKSIPAVENHLQKWTKILSLTSGCLSSRTWKNDEDSAMLLVKMGLARMANQHDGCCWLQFHPITQAFAKSRGGLQYAKAALEGVRKMGNHVNSGHLWSSAFLVFGFKSEPPIVQLKAIDLVLYIKRTALPLAIQAFTTFSRCNSALELLKVCTNALEEVEKSFVSQIQDWSHDSICWKRRMLQRSQKVDEYVWQDVTLLKATLLETRAKLLARGGHLDSGKELCRTCISIRTVMLGHNHAQTLAAQDTLARLVRMRTKI